MVRGVSEMLLGPSFSTWSADSNKCVWLASEFVCSTPSIIDTARVLV